MSAFCFVHGSAQGPAGWKLLVSALKKRGHDCICVDLPIDRPDASATEYAAAIGAAVARTDKPVIVAHSASGLFLPLVPNYVPVERLVYLAAVIPLPGSSFLAQVQRDPGTYRPDFLKIRPTDFDATLAEQYLFHDCSPDVIPWAISTVRLMYARQAIVEPSPLNAWLNVASSYISCTEDRTINPDWWETAARERLGIDPIRITAGHCPHVSRPNELATILDTLLIPAVP